MALFYVAIVPDFVAKICPPTQFPQWLVHWPSCVTLRHLAIAFIGRGGILSPGTDRHINALLSHIFPRPVRNVRQDTKSQALQACRQHQNPKTTSNDCIMYTIRPRYDANLLQYLNFRDVKSCVKIVLVSIHCHIKKSK